MKNTFRFLILLVMTSFIFAGCEDQDDNDVPASLRINNFIWKGLNLYYLWQPDVTDLADDRFNNQSELNEFLELYPDHFDLFNHLRVDPSIDRFSVMFSDYSVLEGVLSGTTKNNGVDFGLRYKSGSTTDIFGWVRYILPNSDASTKDIHRGDLFYAINGTPLTIDNYQTLLASDTYTLNLANYDNGNITPNGETVTLTKTTYSENPVLISTVIETGPHRIGYLVYNGFYPNYESQLNAAFGQLQSQNITDLVLDLRYNSGGSVQTATYLASMITGQFNGELFAKEQWNPKVQAHYEETAPETLRNNFTSQLSNGAAINSLNLNRVFILTSRSTASASELVINGLAPYINVVQIGDFTTGKNVGSITLYDSQDFSRNGRSSAHKYAMQPIVLKIANKDNFADYLNGLAPDTELVEDFSNFGILGDASEPLLSTAIGQITGSGRMIRQNPEHTFLHFKDSKSINHLQDQMYIDKLPEGFVDNLK